MSDEIDVRVDIKARLYWRTPPKSRAEAIMREHAEIALNIKAQEFEKELRAILLSDIKVSA